jgi:hypothetical protein
VVVSQSPSSTGSCSKGRHAARQPCLSPVWDTGSRSTASSRRASIRRTGRLPRRGPVAPRQGVHAHRGLGRPDPGAARAAGSSSTGTRSTRTPTTPPRSSPRYRV